MKIAMNAEFKVLKVVGNGMYFPLDKEDVQNMTIGAFSFVIGGRTVPFDWNACSGSEKDKVFRFEMGPGPFFKEYELSDCYDEDYKALGVERKDITAEYLASAEFVEEFHVNFDDQEGHEVSLGWHEDNAGAPVMKVKLFSVQFEDLESGKSYSVQPEVLENYNKGLTREQVFAVTQKDMDEMANRADSRLRMETRALMADLDLQIQFANEVKVQGAEGGKCREDVSLERE